MYHIFIFSTKPGAYICALFLTLDWYLMSWANKCDHSHVNHIYWHDEFIIIRFPYYKGDQEGVNCNDPWNIY